MLKLSGTHGHIRWSTLKETPDELKVVIQVTCKDCLWLRQRETTISDCADLYEFLDSMAEEHQKHG